MKDEDKKKYTKATILTKDASRITSVLLRYWNLDKRRENFLHTKNDNSITSQEEEEIFNS